MELEWLDTGADRTLEPGTLLSLDNPGLDCTDKCKYMLVRYTDTFPDGSVEKLAQIKILHDHGICWKAPLMPSSGVKQEQIESTFKVGDCVCLTREGLDSEWAQRQPLGCLAKRWLIVEVCQGRVLVDNYNGYRACLEFNEIQHAPTTSARPGLSYSAIQDAHETGNAPAPTCCGAPMRAQKTRFYCEACLNEVKR